MGEWERIGRIPIPRIERSERRRENPRNGAGKPDDTESSKISATDGKEKRRGFVRNRTVLTYLFSAPIAASVLIPCACASAPR